MSFFDKPNYFELFIFSSKILSGKTWELKNFSCIFAMVKILSILLQSEI